MTSFSLPSRLALTALCAVGVTTAQPDQSSPVKRLVVMLNASGEAGTGVIAGFQRNLVHVLTADHVIKGSSSQSAKFRPEFLRQAGVKADQPKQGFGCSIDMESPELDLAVIRCELPAISRRALRLRFDAAAGLSAIRRTSRVSFIGNVQTPWFSPANWGFIAESDVRRALLTNSFGMNLKGASGGPLLSDDDRIAGIVEKYDEDAGLIVAVPWDTVSRWLRDHKFPLAVRKRAAAPLGPNDTEVAASYLALDFPTLGTLSAPGVRISKRLQHVGQSAIAFDFTQAGNPDPSASQFRSLRLSLPMVSYQYQIGQSVPIMRRIDPLSGFYLGAGLGFALQDSKETDTVIQTESVRSWAGVFELGVRYRLPARAWGIQGSYREYVLTDQGPEVRYPRFRSFGIGLFATIR